MLQGGGNNRINDIARWRLQSLYVQSPFLKVFDISRCVKGELGRKQKTKLLCHFAHFLETLVKNEDHDSDSSASYQNDFIVKRAKAIRIYLDKIG